MENKKEIPAELVGCGSEQEKAEKGQKQYADYC